MAGAALGLWRPGRGFTTIDPPPVTRLSGGAPATGTIAADVNDRGQVLLPAPGILFKGRSVPLAS